MQNKFPQSNQYKKIYSFDNMFKSVNSGKDSDAKVE